MKGTLMFIGSKCPYCNKIFTEADDIVVCPECGTPLVVKKVCSNCGAELEDVSKFCPECGTPCE